MCPAFVHLIAQSALLTSNHQVAMRGSPGSGRCNSTSFHCCCLLIYNKKGVTTETNHFLKCFLRRWSLTEGPKFGLQTPKLSKSLNSSSCQNTKPNYHNHELIIMTQIGWMWFEAKPLDSYFSPNVSSLNDPIPSWAPLKYINRHKSQYHAIPCAVYQNCNKFLSCVT